MYGWAQHMFGLIKPMPHGLFCLGKINAYTDILEKPCDIKLSSESMAEKYVVAPLLNLL